MERKHTFNIDEYYHLYNRGNGKSIIFKDKHDYKRFMALLYLCNQVEPIDIREHFNKGKSFVDIFKSRVGQPCLVGIGAYCLMPNHFHIFLQEKVEGGITSFMRKLATGYSVYFNKRHNRTGSLLEGKFKSQHVHNASYFNYLFSYIHLNPLKIIDYSWKESGISDIEKAKKYMDSYEYSSYHDYFINKRVEGSIIDKKTLPKYFSEMNDFEEIIKVIPNKGRSFVG